LPSLTPVISSPFTWLCLAHARHPSWRPSWFPDKFEVGERRVLSAPR
jgi:hypothetical protein